MPVIALVVIAVAVCGVNGTAFVEGAVCLGVLIWLMSVVGASMRD